MKTSTKTALILILLLAFTITLSAQQSETSLPKLTGTYLGQKPPGMIPELFAPGIVSTGNHEHSRIVFSKDGNEIYWIVIPVDTHRKNEHGRPFQANEQNIYFTARVNEEWEKPSVLPLTKQLTPIALALSPENKFYFQVYDQETDPKESPRPKKLFMVEKIKNQWGNPGLSEDILPNINGKAIMTLCFANSGNVYYDLGGPDSTGGWNWSVYVRELVSGKYQESKLLEGGINDDVINWCPWISPDESYIIWSSHREGNFGNGDLYISFKNKNGSWSTPINMGNRINTEGQERFPSVSPDGKYLFFARHKDSITYSDFYWVSAKIIEELKPKEI
jgi:hypothetical protein